MKSLFSRFCLMGAAFMLCNSSCRQARPLRYAVHSDRMLRKVYKHRKEYHPQIIYTRIDRDKNNIPHFKTYTLGVDTSQYFYPASTVKLPYAALALERFHAHGPVVSSNGDTFQINCFDSLLAKANGPCQTTEWQDTTAFQNRASIAHYIRRMLLVSDNRAYNRVFDWVGKSGKNGRLAKLGYSGSRVIQRFDPACTPENNRKHNTFTFFKNQLDSFSVYWIEDAPEENPVKNCMVGKAYYKGDSLIHEPRSFRYNNNLPLPELDGILQKIMLPEAFDKNQNFQLSDSDYRFLWKYMCMYPYESAWPHYDSSYFPLYKKYLYYGCDPKGIPDSSIRIFNIVGQAYGFTTDAAYIVDFQRNIEFFVSATIYTNADGLLNDDKYEYQSIAFPFMKALGRKLYSLECHRKRTYAPDLRILHPSVLFPSVD